MLHILQKYKQYFILFSFIVISRSPGFFNISTESDFATYILVANSYVSGLGLYNNIIEIKPFLNFLPFILAIFFFGKNFFLIQFLGAVTIFFTCCILIKIYEKLFAKKNYIIGYIYSFYTTYLVSAGLDFQPQLIAVFFYLLALFIFLEPNINVNKRSFFLGFCLGCAALTRQNFMICALIINIILPIILHKKEINFFKKYFTSFLLISLGGVISLIIFFIPFAIKDFANIFNLIFIAPSYFLSKDNIIIGLIHTIGYSLWLYKFDIKIIPSLIYYLISFLGFVYCNKNKYLIFNLFFISSFFGIILTNEGNNQHLIQVAPFLSCYFIYFIKKILNQNFEKKLFLFFLICLIFFFYKDINNQEINHKLTTFNSLHKYLSNNLQNNDSIYINGVSNNLYWLIDKYPPISIAHYTNIDKNELLIRTYGEGFDSIFFYKKIYEIQPSYIILEKDLESFFSNYLSFNEIQNFRKKYFLIKTFKNTNAKYERLFRNKYSKTLINTQIYLYKKK